MHWDSGILSLLSFLFVCLKLWACSQHAPLPWTSSWPETQNQWEQQSMDQNLKKKWRLKNKPFIIYHLLSWAFCYSYRKLTMMEDFFEGHKLSQISGPSYGMSRLKKLEMNFQKASQIATLCLPCIWSEWTLDNECGRYVWVTHHFCCIVSIHRKGKL